MKYTRQYLGHLSRVNNPAVIDEILADTSLTSAERKSALENLESAHTTHRRALQLRASAGADGAQGAGANLSGGVVTKSVERGGSPFAFAEDDLRGLHQAVVSRSSMAIKAFSTADSLLPAQLAPQVLGPVHENRLLDKLPTQPISAPSYEYIRHHSTTGAAAIVAEGAAKPEIVLNTDTLIATVQKIACHGAVSWEQLRDWDTFVGYVQAELARQLIDVENAELLNGAGTTGHLTGLLATSGALTHDHSADATGVTALDAIEMSIAAMRVGAALAEPDLLVLHPTTWSAIRRSKDSQNRYLVAPDPTADEANSVWGVEVLVTTVLAAGAGALLDTKKFGKVLVRDGLTMQTGTNNDDFTKNLVRFICEERLALAVERPAAVLSITNLPTS
jgi:HK97 family phage major capsid protein